MKTTIQRLTQGATRLLVLALGLGLAATGWADFAKTNPVTGETENYTWKFVGTDTWDGTGNWQDSSDANPSGTPAKSGENTWDPILFDGNTININASMSVEGWNLRMGLYNGANVTMNNFVKYQGDTTMWMTVDESSLLTIGGFGGGNITANQVIKLSVATANGITWTANLTSGNANNTFEYYLKGTGSVSYQAVSAANHKIKMADVTLSGNEKSVQSKTLVSFTSSSPTFTADATIKRFNSSGTDLENDAHVATVNSTGTTTLTTDNAVGTCELVQTSTGIVLYWVDGDPDALTPTVYKPSININFTNGAANGLTTGADVGLTGYEVPGTSWNNFVVANSTFSTVNAIDSTGAASAMSGVSVTISNVSGSWSCSGLTASSDFRQSYIDESASYPTPTVTVTGIPYYKYRVLVYHSTDTQNVPFGYDTINGTNYAYVNDALAESTMAWGDSGPNNSANAIAEGGNVLVTEALSGSSLTVVGHRAGGASNARGCIAAIQIIEVKPETTENDLIIDVSGDTPYTVSEAKTLSGTVYLTGNGTLTLDGSAKISAATINVGSSVILNINADRLDGTTFTGAGTVVYDGSQPDIGKGWADSDNWKGTVWVKNIGSAPAGETTNTAVTLGSDTQTAADNTINRWGNANSYVKFTNVRGHIAAANCPWTLVLEDGVDTYAWYNNNGWTGRDITIAAIEGDGTFYDQANNGCRQILTFTEASNFAGSFNISGKRVGLGANNTADNNQTYRGTIEVASGKTVTVAAGKTWTTGMGFCVYGTINATGTLAADSTATACAVGTGTVVFGGVPSPTGDKWWKNAAWTGTVEIKGATALNGDYAFNDYGNSGSTLKLTNCSGWLKPNYTCVPALEIGGTFTWNDGSSGLNNTFKVATLKGSGTISIPNQGAATAVWQITDDWSGFTGAVVGNNGAAKRILVFGSTLPTTATAGVIYVSEGATLDLDNASGAWWGVGMGFVVDGTVKASSRSKWGGGTYMTLGDTGVLELVSTANTDDQNTEMGNITGTGTLKFSSSAGWRAYPKADANMPATTLTIQTELADSLILPTKNDGETVIGSLAGSKNLRSDWSSNGSNGRILTVTQSKDTEWQGKFVANRTTQFNVVAPAEGTPGTLTLSGTQSLSSYDVITIPMQVNGSVCLTGTWVGNTTVSGKFGGTGTLTGNLTFSDGATFEVYDGTDPIAVSGTVTFPTNDNETATIDLTGVALDPAGTTLISGASSIGDIDNVSANGAILKVESGALKAYPVAALTKADDSVVTYTTAQAAVKATPYNSGYKYVTIYQSNVSVTMVGTSLKLKLADGVTGVTVSNPFDEFAISSSTESGVTTYTLANNPTVYTWDSGTSVGVWNSMVVTPWRYSKNDTPTQANRAPALGDDVIFASEASVTVGENISVDSITNSAALTFTKSSSDVTITAASGGIVLTDAAASITVTGVTLSPTPTTTVANSYVKLTDSTYSVQAFVTVTIPVVENASATVNGDAVAGGASVRVDAGSNVTIAWTAASGYRITAGATQTINAIAADVTAMEPTVEQNNVNFSDYEVVYLANYNTATTIVATVTGEGAANATYKLYTNEVEVATGFYENGKVTFYNIGGLELGGTLSYTIAASGAATGSSEAQSSTVGNVTSGWVQEDSTHYEATGSWATDFTYSGTVATLTDNTYTANTAGDGIVTITTVVKFGGEADSEVQVGDDAQAAVRIQNSKFEVWGKTTSGGSADWQTTVVAAEDETTYTVTLTINYTTRKFTVSVGGDSLGEYFLATAATKISSVAYTGTGEFTSLNGSFVSGDIAVNVESKNVAVSSEFISQYLDGKTVAQAAAALNPNATQDSNPEAFADNGNGINYFTCYALGLNPTKEDDKLVVDVSTDENGKFVFTVKHPTFDEKGNITGYEEIDAADNVTATVTYKYGTTAGSTNTDATLDEGGKISPSAMFDGQGGNVLYYKAQVSISAK